MGTLVICSLWTVAALWLGWHMGRASLREEIKQLRRDRHYLKKWLNQQVRATMETDLELELERMRND